MKLMVLHETHWSAQVEISWMLVNNVGQAKNMVEHTTPIMQLQSFLPKSLFEAPQFHFLSQDLKLDDIIGVNVWNHSVLTHNVANSVV